MTTDDKPAADDTNSADLAAEIIRQKINSLYASQDKPQRADSEAHEPSAKVEAQVAEQETHRSKHQQFMHQLNNSGRTTAEVQTAWHQYYEKLSDAEKHQVWQEFYSEQAKLKQAPAEPKPEPETKEPTAKSARRTVEQVKGQLLSTVNARGKLTTKHHVQSILFGLGVGSLSVLILLFGFFNERIIAPFITPSRSVTNTPIISGSNQASTNAATVVIPKINVEIPVIYDQKSIDEKSIQTSLESGVVHYATTASPGEQGNTVIFGHSSNNILNKGRYKFAFVLLNRLQVGDTFTLTKDGKRYVYQIYERKIVEPTDVSVLGTASKPATATLITCDPPGTSLRRLVVIGEQISPNPSTNTASTAIQANGQPAIVPSDAPSLWQRIRNLFS